MFYRFLLLLVVFVLLYFPGASAHGLPAELVQKWLESTRFSAFGLGYLSILPFGWDHVLFILCLFLLKPVGRLFLWQSILLGLSILSGFFLFCWLELPIAVNTLEILIALSVLWLSLENIITPKLRPVRLILIVLFGQLHGAAFSNAFREWGAGLPSIASSFLFAGGLLAALLTCIAVLALVLLRWLGEKSYFRRRITLPLSGMSAFIALIWVLERLHFAL